MTTEELTSVIYYFTIYSSTTTASTPSASGYLEMNADTPTPVADNTSPTPVDPTAEFKNFINEII